MVTRVDQSLTNAEYFIKSGDQEKAMKNIYVGFRAVSGLLTGIIHHSDNDEDLAKLMPGIFSDAAKVKIDKKDKAKDYENKIRWVPGKGPMMSSQDFCENLLFQLSNLHRMLKVGKNIKIVKNYAFSNKI